MKSGQQDHARLVGAQLAAATCGVGSEVPTGVVCVCMRRGIGIGVAQEDKGMDTNTYCGIIFCSPLCSVLEAETFGEVLERLQEAERHLRRLVWMASFSPKNAVLRARRLPYGKSCKVDSSSLVKEPGS